MRRLFTVFAVAFSLVAFSSMTFAQAAAVDKAAKPAATKVAKTKPAAEKTAQAAKEVKKAAPVATGKVAMIGLPRNLQNAPFPPGPARNSSACGCFHGLLNEMYVEATVRHPSWWPGSGAVKGIGAVRSMVMQLTGRPVDAVLHFASPASPIDYLKLPIQTLKVGSLGTHNALGLAKAKGARFVLASTSEIYGDPLEHPQKETYWGNVNPIGPRGVYDEAKRFAEAMTMAYYRYHGVDTRIVRIFNTFGPRMRLNDGRVVPNFVAQALQGQPLTVYGDGQQTRSFCYVADLVEGRPHDLLPREPRRARGDLQRAGRRR